jgi:peptide-methionine (R)-S-oxide reductase
MVRTTVFTRKFLLLLPFAVVGHSFVTDLPTLYDVAMKPSKSSQFSKNGDTVEDDDTKIVPKTWNPIRLGVLRLGLTEPAMTSALNYGKFDGKFTCAYCGHELFDSAAKYDSRSGWPSFWRTSNEDSVSYKPEMDGRLECRCKKCSSHLGHVFLDGPRPSSVEQDLLATSPTSDPRGKKSEYLPRFCVNGSALRYNPQDIKDS